MGMRSGRLARRGSVAVVVAATLGLLAACAPSPGTTVFDGGTYDVELVVPPQVASTSFDLFGLTTCTSEVTTPSVEVRGTATLAPAELDPHSAVVRIPSATVELPRTRASAGSWTLTCWDAPIVTVGFSVELDGVVSAHGALLDTTTNRVTVDDPTIAVTDAVLLLDGEPFGIGPIPLDPFTVTVPAIDVTF